ncbi:hypothetical protein AG1IA_08308 [Rhizoctonia solani AG-1 IA]|uniref:Uncharacterized protein n=1 Tax=Thanatephorus cucumeris (strain AG1-IA) TaxID=983506 RepID=L8WHG1_THACA|nr:hypothetical protein AG1IA_08308 [Rhizoctonia solani AG-1 IA]
MATIAVVPDVSCCASTQPLLRSGDGGCFPASSIAATSSSVRGATGRVARYSWMRSFREVVSNTYVTTTTPLARIQLMRTCAGVAFGPSRVAILSITTSTGPPGSLVIGL